MRLSMPGLGAVSAHPGPVFFCERIAQTLLMACNRGVLLFLFPFHSCYEALWANGEDCAIFRDAACV